MMVVRCRALVTGWVIVAGRAPAARHAAQRAPHRTVRIADQFRWSLTVPPCTQLDHANGRDGPAVKTGARPVACNIKVGHLRELVAVSASIAVT